MGRRGSRAVSRSRENARTRWDWRVFSGASPVYHAPEGASSGSGSSPESRAGTRASAIDTGTLTRQVKHLIFRPPRGTRTVAKPELGTKRLCTNCGAKFYDLSKDPIVCPKCHSVVEIAAPSSRSRPDPGAAARAAAPAEEEVAAPETAD